MNIQEQEVSLMIIKFIKRTFIMQEALESLIVIVVSVNKEKEKFSKSW